MNERHRKLKKSSNEERPGSSADQNDSSLSISTSSFSTKQSLHRSLSHANNFLPKSPHKKAEVIEKLAEKYKVKFQFKKSARGRPRKDLNEEEKQWLTEFLARANLTYTNILVERIMFIFGKCLKVVSSLEPKRHPGHCKQNWKNQNRKLFQPKI